MIGNSTGISIVELWPCKDTFPTFLHGEVVAAVNKMLTDKCITCQKISGHGFKEPDIQLATSSYYAFKSIKFPKKSNVWFSRYRQTSGFRVHFAHTFR